MGAEAARVGLDPVPVNRRAGDWLFPAAAVGGLESGCAVRDLLERRLGARLGETRGVQAGRGGGADLERLSLRPERCAQAAGAQESERDRTGRALGVEPEKLRGRDGGARGATDGRRMPAPLIQRRVT